jgi:hypothetical protein
MIDELIHKKLKVFIKEIQISKVEVLQKIISKISDELIMDLEKFQEKNRLDVANLYFENYHEIIVSIFKGILLKLRFLENSLSVI